MRNNYFSYHAERLHNHLRSRPYAVRLDTNNTCNLKCIYCNVNDYTKSADYMSVDRFNKLSNLLFPKCRYISLSFGTEPLMSKNFSLFIEELGRQNVPETHFITNGLLLTEKIIQTSIQSGISAITISNDAASPETYKRIRGKTAQEKRAGAYSFKELTEKLKLIQELKKSAGSSKPAIRIQFTFVTTQRPWSPNPARASKNQATALRTQVA